MWILAVLQSSCWQFFYSFYLVSVISYRPIYSLTSLCSVCPFRDVYAYEYVRCPGTFYKWKRLFLQSSVFSQKQLSDQPAGEQREDSPVYDVTSVRVSMLSSSLVLRHTEIRWSRRQFKLQKWILLCIVCWWKVCSCWRDWAHSKPLSLEVC